jgi:hypothetical protein
LQQKLLLKFTTSCQLYSFWTPFFCYQQKLVFSREKKPFNVFYCPLQSHWGVYQKKKKKKKKKKRNQGMSWNYADNRSFEGENFLFHHKDRKHHDSMYIDWLLILWTLPYTEMKSNSIIGGFLNFFLLSARLTHNQNCWFWIYWFSFFISLNYLTLIAAVTFKSCLLYVYKHIK